MDSSHWHCIRTKSKHDVCASVAHADLVSQRCTRRRRGIQKYANPHAPFLLSSHNPFSSPAVVSKAFQVLSDGDMRAAYDSNPTHDPESRFGGGGGGAGPSMSRGFGGGRPGFATEQEITPEDLFNMFFGGGGGFGGGGFGGGPSECSRDGDF